MDKPKNELVVSGGVFNKIKNFFRGLFKKKEIQKEDDVNKKENNFKEEIVIQKDEEKERLMELQEKFRRGEIVKGDLTNEDIEKLSNLYDEQIAELRNKIMNNQILAKKYRQQKLGRQKNV